MRAEYCNQCGAELTTKRQEGRARLYCSTCDRIQYRNPKPCAGVLVVDGNQILLVERTEPSGVGCWSLLAGYLEADEPPAQGAVRELVEETGLRTNTEYISLQVQLSSNIPTGNIY